MSALWTGLAHFVRTPTQMNATAAQVKLPWNYFLLVFVLTVPFWVFGSGKLPLPMNLPVSALMVVTPLIAASILSYQQAGLSGVKALFKKAVDTQKAKNKRWYLPALLLPPLIYFLSFVVMRLLGLPLPDPLQTPFLLAPLFFVMYFISATCEELGWMGYAIDPLQKRWGALTASLILGVVWQLWHFIPDRQAHHPLGWIVWHSLQGVALMVLIVWSYNKTGKSVLAAILLHTMDNVSWSLFPNYGSGFDPSVTGIITIIAAFIVTYKKRGFTEKRGSMATRQ